MFTSHRLLEDLMQRPMDHRFLTKNVSYSRDMVTFLTQCGRLTEPYRGHGQAAAHHPRRPTMSSTGTVMIDWMSCPIAASNLAHRMPLGAAGWSSCARWHAVPVHQKDKIRPRKVIFAVYFSRSQAPCGSAALKFGRLCFLCAKGARVVHVLHQL